MHQVFNKQEFSPTTFAVAFTSMCINIRILGAVTETGNISSFLLKSLWRETCLEFIMELRSKLQYILFKVGKGK